MVEILFSLTLFVVFVGLGVIDIARINWLAVVLFLAGSFLWGFVREGVSLWRVGRQWRGKYATDAHGGWCSTRQEIDKWIDAAGTTKPGVDHSPRKHR